MLLKSLKAFLVGGGAGGGSSKQSSWWSLCLLPQGFLRHLLLLAIVEWLHSISPNLTTDWIYISSFCLSQLASFAHCNMHIHDTTWCQVHTISSNHPNNSIMYSTEARIVKQLGAGCVNFGGVLSSHMSCKIQICMAFTLFQAFLHLGV